MHLILFRVYQRILPRWLDEEFAEYISRFARASYQRARNYNERPHSHSIAANRLIPISRSREKCWRRLGRDTKSVGRRAAAGSWMKSARGAVTSAYMRLRQHAEAVPGIKLPLLLL